MAILEIDSLSFCYAGAKENALSGVTLSVNEGDIAVIFGRSGCGKSTLLRCIKPAVAPVGKMSGAILFDAVPVTSLDERECAADIGLVTQDPDDQLVTDKVWHELAFGLESIGADTQTIRRRVAEISSYFGISDWFHRDVASLSGGQKQILNLAAAAVMHPRLMLLDEPTAQLDPVAENAFMSLVRRMNSDFGTTFVVAEHNIDPIPLDHASLFCMSRGAIVSSGTLSDVARTLKKDRRREFSTLPAASRISLSVGGECADSVVKARRIVSDHAKKNPLCPIPPRRSAPDGERQLLSAKNVCFRYDRRGDDILNVFSLEARGGEWIALFGENGAGKSTALSILAGVKRPYSGRVVCYGRVSMLPQEPQTLFSRSTVGDELDFAASGDGDKVASVSRLCMLEGLADRHPFDLSGGEAQRLALALVLLSEPDVLLLDEPTKGLDKASASAIGAILERLVSSGRAIITASHDSEFCAAHATRCVMMFDGAIAADEPAARFFEGNAYYTTAAARIANGVIPDALTTEDVIFALTGACPDDHSDDGEGRERRDFEATAPRVADKTIESLSENKPPIRLLTLLFALVFVPAALALGFVFLAPEYYYVTSSAIIILGFVPFFLAFEKSRPKARDVVTLAVLCAIGVASRGAFFMTPQFKPVLALCVICGAAFGPEIGFLFGAVTMLVSNLMFSQGPWTPWQMYAMGFVGFLSGLVCRSGIMKRRIPISIFGAAAAIVVYGGIMNPVSALIWSGASISFPMIAGYYAAGFPLDAVHAAASFIFLFCLSRPMFEKFLRLKTKYNVLSGE